MTSVAPTGQSLADLALVETYEEPTVSILGTWPVTGYKIIGGIYIELRHVIKFKEHVGKHGNKKATATRKCCAMSH